MLDLINQIAQPLLLIILPVLAVAATSWLIKAWELKRAELSQAQLTTLNWLAGTAVWAAEQASQSGIIPKTARLSYAIEFVQVMADKYHIKIDSAEIAARIEAAVAEQLNKGRITQPSK
jgi:hypothetical protein